MALIEKNLEFIEFETKYAQDAESLIPFKQIMEVCPGLKDFLYIEGEDQFFTHSDSWFAAAPHWDPEGTFARYRKPAFGLDKGRRQVTFKYKPKDAKDNIQRREHNWDIGKTPEKVIFEQLKDMGMIVDNSLIKSCHIYKFADANVVFYITYNTTLGKPKAPDYFVEIEVNEDEISKMSESEAWAVIEKFEKVLAQLGICKEKRLKKSLYGMYRKRS